jgi:hypothetical protein
VGQSEAERVLGQLQIVEVDGNQLDPIIVSDGVECTSFDLSRYSNENAGTADLLRHHQEQLCRCGLRFGLDGYAMYDARDFKCMQFMCSGKVFKGTTDCILAPFGLLGASAVTCMRVGFEHKQTRKQGARAVSRCICFSVSCRGARAFVLDEVRPSPVCRQLSPSL